MREIHGCRFSHRVPWRHVQPPQRAALPLEATAVFPKEARNSRTDDLAPRAASAKSRDIPPLFRFSLDRLFYWLSSAAAPRGIPRRPRLDRPFLLRFFCGPTADSATPASMAGPVGVCAAAPTRTWLSVWCAGGGLFKHEKPK